MRANTLVACCVVQVLALGAPAMAQRGLELPRASQRAQVRQRLALTDITINYGRPLAKGRKVFGGLVPYGDVWRAGADEITSFEVTDPVKVEGQALPKGIYGLHMIPGDGEWTLIFSKNATSWGSFTYDQAEDALRVKVRPQVSPATEALTYEFNELKPDSTVVTLRWDKVAVPFKVEIARVELVSQNLKEQLRMGSKYNFAAWDQAATFLLDDKGNLQDALKASEESIALEERFDNLLTKSRVLDALGKKDDALATRTKAIAMGDAGQIHSYGRYFQGLGQPELANELFRANMKKFPNSWAAHNEAARFACAKGDFDKAVKEMKAALPGTPDALKPQINNLVKRLEAHEDINK